MYLLFCSGPGSFRVLLGSLRMYLVLLYTKQVSRLGTQAVVLAHADLLCNNYILLVTLVG